MAGKHPSRPSRALLVGAVVVASVGLVEGPSAPPAAALPVLPALPALPVQVAPTLPTVGDAEASYPVRSVPGYATYGGWPVRTSPGNGPADHVVVIPTGISSTPFYGDWDGDGAFTPGYFLNGTWVLFDRMVGTTTAWRSFGFGRAGDRAVVGDWNGDGRTDIAVVRAGVWYQRDDATGGAASRSFGYGNGTDRPLAGDWNGDGRDSPGIWRSRVFHLRNTSSGGAADHQVTFGTATDNPVVGDWDGDRVDTVGVVRTSATWYLTRGHTPANPTSLTISTGAGGYALPYPSPAGPAGDASPTARPGLDLSAVDAVEPPSGLGGSMPAGDLRSAMAAAQKTMLGVELTSDYASRASYKYLDIRGDSTSQEQAVRGAAMSALPVAIGLSMGGYDPAAVGRPRSFAVDYVDWLVRSAAAQHVSITPNGWGRNWQSSMWAGYLGMSAWLLWDELSPQTRAYAAQVVADEADWVASRPVPYWKDPSGNLLTGRSGNSAAEEAAWDAGHLGFAVQMLPGHPNAARWTRVGTQLGVAAYSTQADTQSSRLVNGVRLRDRLGGFNAHADGTVENHGGIHVDYVSVAQYSWWSTIYGALADRPVPEGFLHNRRLNRTAITGLAFRAPPFASPGGVVYRPDGTIYYPAVSSWGTLRYPQWVAYDATSALVVADVDPATGVRDSPSAVDWLARHTSRTRALQLRHPDGHLYEPGEEDYPRAEELNAQLLAMAWAARYAEQNLPDVTVSTGYVPLP